MTCGALSRAVLCSPSSAHRAALDLSQLATQLFGEAEESGANGPDEEAHGGSISTTFPQNPGLNFLQEGFGSEKRTSSITASYLFLC